MQKKRTLRLSLALAISSLAFQGAVHGFAKKYCMVQVFSLNDNDQGFSIYAYENMKLKWLKEKAGITQSNWMWRITAYDASKTESKDIDFFLSTKNQGQTVRELCGKKNHTPRLEPFEDEMLFCTSLYKGDFLAGPAGWIFTLTLHEIEEDRKIPNFTLYYVGWGVQALALVGVVGFVGWTIFKKKYASQSQPRTGSEVKKEEAKAEEAQ